MKLWRVNYPYMVAETSNNKSHSPFPKWFHPIKL